jgi:hypothetical protein
LSPTSTIILSPTPLSTTSTTKNAPSDIPESKLNGYEYIKACIQVDTSLPKEILSKGGIILEDLVREQPVFLMDLHKHQEIYLAKKQEHLSNFAVSPNHQWIAYFMFSDDKSNLVIRNFTTGNVIELPIGEKWDRLIGWVNNTQILISLVTDSYAPPLILFNPFTQMEISVPSTYPNQVLVSGTTPLPRAAYNPSTNKVVYLWSQENMRGLVLYDKVQTRQIALFPTLSFVMVAAPQWSYDGTKFAFSVSPLENEKTSRYSFELMISDDNGNVQRVTNLYQNIASFYIRDLAWSTDDSYLAFSVYDLDKGVRLMFLDMVNNKVIDPCVDLIYGSNLVWAPSKNQLVVISPSPDTKENVLLIDLDLLKAGVLTKGEQLYINP